MKTISVVSLLCFFLVSLTAVPPVNAGEEQATVKVGVRTVKPFIFLDGQEPKGFAIDLWQATAREMELSYTYVANDGISDTLEDLMGDKIDLAIGAITVTKEREEKIDFTYSYFHTGLGIMVPEASEFSLFAFVNSFLTTQRLQRIGFFLLFLLATSHVIWFAERRANHTFHRKYLPGIFEGVYWSIVTASTVGYGDYTPKSKTGQILAILIILVSLPLFALFIGNISSDITLHKLRNTISGPGDLAELRVGIVKGSTAEKYVKTISKNTLYAFSSTEGAYQGLIAGDLDAVVDDRPTLQYFQQHIGKGKVKVLDATFAKQHYAFAMAKNITLQEELNRALLTLIENGTFATIHGKWFGHEEP